MLEELEEESLITTLTHLKERESVVYYTGFLACDSFMNRVGAEFQAAHTAYELFEKGYVHLTQRRIGESPSKFEYIATGASNVVKMFT